MKIAVFATYPDLDTAPGESAAAPHTAARKPSMAVVPIRPAGDPFGKLVRFAQTLVTDAVADPSRRIYAHALESFLNWAAEDGGRPFTKATVQAYRAHLEAKGLAPATINLRLSAVRKLAVE